MSAQEEVRASCPSCGEEISLYVELDGGEEQELVEDCWVCCRPIVFRLRVERDGSVALRAEAE